MCIAVLISIVTINSISASTATQDDGYIVSENLRLSKAMFDEHKKLNISVDKKDNPNLEANINCLQSGKNLIGRDYCTGKTENINGLTITYNLDGSILVDGYSTDTTVFYMLGTYSDFKNNNASLLLPAGTYTFSSTEDELSLYARINGVDKALTGSITSNQPICVNQIWGELDSHTNYDGYKIYPMLERGRWVTEWEPPKGHVNLSLEADTETELTAFDGTNYISCWDDNGLVKVRCSTENSATVKKNNALYGQNMLCIGDSITWYNYKSGYYKTDDQGRYSPTGTPTEIIGYQQTFETLGASVNSYTVNGGTISKYDSSLNMGSYRSAYTKIFESGYDFSQYDIVTILLGTNDPLYRKDDLGSAGKQGDTSFDLYRTISAMRSAVEKIISNSPNTRIVLISPIYSSDNSRSTSRMSKIANGYKTISSYYSNVFFIDGYRKSGITSANQGTYLFDGVHPSNSGHELIGDYFASVLSNPYFYLDEEAPTETSTETSTILGDADGDGYVTIIDSAYIQEWLAELIPDSYIHKNAADINKNGIIDIMDATRIQRWLAGVIPDL